MYFSRPVGVPKLEPRSIRAAAAFDKFNNYLLMLDYFITILFIFQGISFLEKMPSK